MAFCFILKHKITLFYLLSFVFIHFITRCHSLSLIVIFCYSLSFVVTRCHSLSLLVTRCHSFYHSLSFVVTRCTTRLSFYKRSFTYVSLFIWCVTWGHDVCWFEIHWKVLTFPMLNITETIKIEVNENFPMFPSFQFQV